MSPLSTGLKVNNWVKKKILLQTGDSKDSPWILKEVDSIPSSLSFDVDVTTASPLRVNADSQMCFQGQTHGNDGFLLTPREYYEEIQSNPATIQFLHPFLITDDLIGTKSSLPTRYVIDFDKSELLSILQYNRLFKRLQEMVLPDREEAAQEEAYRNREARQINPHAKVTKDHENALRKWWQLFRRRSEMMTLIKQLPRYLVCGRVTKRPIFEFIHPEIYPNDSLTVFTLADNYSFGILQSQIHWIWFINRCSTMKSDPRYTSNTVFDSFPWPQSPLPRAINDIAHAARELHHVRRILITEHNLSLRDLYRSIELPGKHPLKDVQEALDDAVRQAFGMSKRQNPLEFLLALNGEVAAKETSGQQVTAPGLPPSVIDRTPYITDECISMPL